MTCGCVSQSATNVGANPPHHHYSYVCKFSVDRVRPTVCVFIVVVTVYTQESLKSACPRVLQQERKIKIQIK